MTDSSNTEVNKPIDKGAKSLMGYIASDPPDGSRFTLGLKSFIRRNGEWIDEETGNAIILCESPVK